MTTDLTAARGRALIRLVEAADFLLSSESDLGDLALLRRARLMAADRLRALLADLPPGLAAEILANVETPDADA